MADVGLGTVRAADVAVAEQLPVTGHRGLPGGGRRPVGLGGRRPVGVDGRRTGGVGGRRVVAVLRWVPVVALVLLVVGAVVVPLVAGTDPRDVDLRAVLQPPSASHLLGTDASGRDVLLRSFAGLRVSLVVGLVAALVAGLIGTVVGVLAGTVGGWVDRALMRTVDAVAAVPHLLLGIFIVALFRPSLTAVIASVALTHWVSTARIVRSIVLALRQRPYVDAAVVAGAARWDIALRHHVPAITPHALLAWSLMVPHAIMHESALSFLGLGLPPHLPSLGTMIAAGQASLLAGQWWPTVVPGAFVVLLGLCVIASSGELRRRWAARLPQEERW